jgi:hypothetical protein
MKRITANVTSLMVVFLLFTAAGYAQHQTQNLKADVPFEFSVGQKAFPAGEYRVAEVAPHTLTLRNTNNGLAIVFLTKPMLSLAGSTPKLEFEELEDGRVVLSEVWANGGTGYKLHVPRRLPALAQNRPAGSSPRN